MKYEFIQAAFDDYLATLDGLPELQLENTRNIAKTGQPFSRASLRPTESVTETNTKSRYGGLYVIDLYYPQDTGTADSNAMADAVIAHFKHATQHRLTTPDVTVQIEKAWREAGMRREPFYAAQVVVKFHCLI